MPIRANSQGFHQYYPGYDRKEATLEELLDELVEIQRNGMMRLHAQNRESLAIQIEIERRGFVLIKSDGSPEDDFDWAIARSGKEQYAFDDPDIIVKHKN